jgi:hypothetical protein
MWLCMYCAIFFGLYILFLLKLLIFSLYLVFFYFCWNYFCWHYIFFGLCIALFFSLINILKNTIQNHLYTESSIQNHLYKIINIKSSIQNLYRISYIYTESSIQNHLYKIINTKSIQNLIYIYRIIYANEMQQVVAGAPPRASSFWRPPGGERRGRGEREER